jgi:hypothetical protein
LEAQTAEGVSTVEKVQTALLDRDEALQRAREDLAEGAHFGGGVGEGGGLGSC